MQTSVSYTPTAGLPGLDGDSGGDVISRVVSTLQLEQITVANNTNGTYAISIDSVEEGNSVALNTSVTVLTAALLLDLQNSTNAFSAEASGTDKILVESTDRWDTDGFTCAVTVDGAAAADIYTNTLVAQGQTIQAGIGVCTDDRAAVSGKQCRLPRQSTDITARFLGITRLDTSLIGDSAEVYGNQAAVSIKRKGRIWVRVQDAVAEMGDVYCRYATAATGYGLGSFRSDADTSNAAQVPNAKYLTAASAGGLALVELS